MKKKRITMLTINFVGFLVFGHTVPAYADKIFNLSLPIKDLTWLSYQPSDDIKKVVAHFSKKYDVTVDSMAYTGLNYYSTGDRTRAMSWAMTFDFDDREKLTGIKYSHFKLEREGIPIKTNRGIRIGTGIYEVIKRYGKVKEVKSNKQAAYFLNLPYPFLIEEKTHPVYDYVILTYPFVIKDTSQKGELKFTLRYKKGLSRNDAVVVQMEYQLRE